MKYIKIIIMVNSDNENLNYNSVIYFVKSEIIKYFGTKNVTNEEPSQPFINVLCEVTNEDLNYLSKSIGNDSVNLFAIIIPDNCDKFKDKILDLSK